MKHVHTFEDFINENHVNERLTQTEFVIRTEKSFNMFDLIDALKQVGGEVLDSQPWGDGKNDLHVTVSAAGANMKRVTDEIAKTAKIVKTL
jgi:TFIIF-interacting CTD phosphatase-like protein